MTDDVFGTRRAKGSVNFAYYELTELLALIDGDGDIELELIQSARRKISKKCRAIEKRFEQGGSFSGRHQGTDAESA